MTSCSSRRPKRGPTGEGTEMTHYAGIDVSLETSSICVVDASGAVVRELKVQGEPEVAAVAVPLARMNASTATSAACSTSAGDVSLTRFQKRLS